MSNIAQAAINCPVDEENQHSSVVRIINKSKGTFCTGTILNGGKHILTAAHCLKEPKSNKENAFTLSGDISINGGAKSELPFGSIKNVIIHPKYKDEFDYHDIAILELSYPVNANSKFPEIDFSSVNAHDEVTIGGYGVNQLNAFLADGKRRVGLNKIGTVDNQYICMETTTILEDGRTPLNPTGCIGAGQDSGSAMMSKGKIRGVLVQSIQKWDQNNTVVNNCFLNLANPEIHIFIVNTFETEVEDNKEKDIQCKTGTTEILPNLDKFYNPILNVTNSFQNH